MILGGAGLGVGTLVGATVGVANRAVGNEVGAADGTIVIVGDAAGFGVLGCGVGAAQATSSIVLINIIFFMVILLVDERFCLFRYLSSQATLVRIDSEIGPSSFGGLPRLLRRYASWYITKNPQLLIENWGAADALKNTIKLPFRVH